MLTPELDEEKNTKLKFVCDAERDNIIYTYLCNIIIQYEFDKCSNHQMKINNHLKNYNKFEEM